MNEQISPRSRQLLKTLVESYIRDGQPVGSKRLVQESGLDVSASTVRNIMGDLEGRGLVSSPHTSAGRVPTHRGYRFFVDSLLTVKPLDRARVSKLARELAPGMSLTRVAESVSTALSGLTRLAGLVMVPAAVPQVLRHIEFLPLQDRQVLVILVVNDHEVQNLVIRPPRSFSEAELQQAANYLNSLFAGRRLADVRRDLLTELQRTRDQMASLMQDAIRMAEQVFESPAEAPDADCVISGQTNLMGLDDLSDITALRGLFEAFSEKREILGLLDHAINGQGVKIFIGEESGNNLFSDCSLVTASYEVDGEVLGAVGVVGPTRMAYDRVIPIVDMTAQLITATLKPKDKPL